MKPLNEVALYALRFILQSYASASPVEMTVHVRAEVNRMHDLKDELEARSGLPDMDDFLPEERLTLRNVLRGLREAVGHAAQLNVEMAAYGLGEAPTLAEIDALLELVGGRQVTA